MTNGEILSRLRRMKTRLLESGEPGSTFDAEALSTAIAAVSVLPPSVPVELERSPASFPTRHEPGCVCPLCC